MSNNVKELMKLTDDELYDIIGRNYSFTYKHEKRKLRKKAKMKSRPNWFKSTFDKLSNEIFSDDDMCNKEVTTIKTIKPEKITEKRATKIEATLSINSNKGREAMQIEEKNIKDRICMDPNIIKICSTNNTTELIAGISTLLSAIFPYSAAIAGAIIIVRTGFNIYCTNYINK